MIRKLLAATLITLTASAGGAFAANSWTLKGVNFREGPSASYPVISYLPRCAVLTASEWENGWVRVRWNDSWGWVVAKHISDSNEHCGSKPKRRTYQPEPSYQGSNNGY
jgi:uncharacterized protein YraI